MSGLSVQNLGEMRAKVKAWTDRNDIADTVYNDFINIAVRKANRALRLEERVEKSTIAIDNNKVELPTDYLETKNVYVEIDNKRWALKRKPDAFVQERQATYVHPYDSSVAYPMYFSREKDFLNIAPNAGTISEVDLYYWKEVLPLTSDTGTNWLITDASVAILYGALSELGNYIMDDDLMMKWKGEFENELMMIQMESDKEHWSGNTLSIMP